MFLVALSEYDQVLVESDNEVSDDDAQTENQIYLWQKRQQVNVTNNPSYYCLCGTFRFTFS